VPGQHGQLAGDRDDRDRVTASAGDPPVEGVEGTRHPSGAEGGLGEEAPNMALAGVADVAGIGRPAARLADDRIKTEIADELVRAGEALDVADDRDQADRGLQPDARDRQQPPDAAIVAASIV
jgi:hypothetical protein